jgi:serine/threonine-protein kinase HipA
MARQALIYFKEALAGTLMETETGYTFSYHNDYLLLPNKQAISFAFPLNKQVYKSNILFPFFDGLIPEGWLLDIAEKNWKLNQKDRMGLLLACCQNCIGAVSIIEQHEEV